MSVDALRAAQTYADIARTVSDAARSQPVEMAVKPDFSHMVNDALEQTQASLAAGEAAGAAVASGQASLVDVVTAVSAAEVTLQTAIAVRNRVIEAYQDILRMPI